MTVALAKRLVEPTWCTVCGVPWNGTGEPVWVETFGPEVGELAASAGMAPDPEQQLILDVQFAIGSAGLPLVFETDIVGPRQNFKTGTVLMMELGWLYVVPQRLCIHTSHKTASSFEAFGDLRRLIEGAPHLAKYLDTRVGRDAESRGITEAATRWGIHLRFPREEIRERRLLYLARSKGVGRSLAGDKVVLDEAYAVEPVTVGDLYPVLSTRPEAQVVLASSAGQRQSSVLRKARDEGRKGVPGRRFYIEYGDPEAGQGCELDNCSHVYGVVTGCAYDDEERWARIMPALGRRITVETVRSLRESMPASMFGQELMVEWDDPPGGDAALALDLDRWTKLRNPNAPKLEAAAIVIEVAEDRSESSIAVAGRGTKGRTLMLTYTEPGTGWVAKKVRALTQKRTVLEVKLNPGTQASVVMAKLDELGVEHEKLTDRETAQACGWFLDAVNKGTSRLEHVGQRELAQAVATATTVPKVKLETWAPDTGTALKAAATAAHRWTLLADYDVDDSYL